VEAKALKGAVANWIKEPLPVGLRSLCQLKARHWQKPLKFREVVRSICT